MKVLVLSEKHKKKEVSFYKKIKEEFGTRGLLDAKKFLAQEYAAFEKYEGCNSDYEELLSAFQIVFLDAKRKNRLLYTPYKYRK